MKIRSMQTCIMSSLPRCIFRCSVFRYVTLISFFFFFFFQTLLFNCNSFTLVANKYLLTYFLLFSLIHRRNLVPSVKQVWRDGRFFRELTILGPERRPRLHKTKIAITEIKAVQLCRKHNLKDLLSEYLVSCISEVFDHLLQREKHMFSVGMRTATQKLVK